MYTFRTPVIHRKSLSAFPSDPLRMPVDARNKRPPASQNPPPDALPDASALEDKTPDWFRTSSASCVFLLGLGLIFVLFYGSAPLWHSDLWDHINYGQRILDTGTVPSTEPLLPFAKGMPMINTSWGAQVGMAAINNNAQLGLAGLQFVNGLLVVIALGAVGWAIWNQSGSVVFAMLGYCTFLILNWQQFLVIRPQLIGVTLFAILLAALTNNAPRRKATFFLLPFMFALWANLHGSFAMGLTLLGQFTVGRFCDTYVRSRSLKLAVRSRNAWRLVLLVQLCAAAVLLNPNGLAVYGEVLRVGGHPNISSMFEWDPLTLRMKQGKAAAVVGALLLIVLRISPRRLRVDQTLALLTTGGLALWSSRMINWFAPVAAFVLAVHGAAAWRHWFRKRRTTDLPQRRGLWTIVNLGLCWIFFSLTSLGVQTMHGKTPEVRRSLSRATPISLGDYLAKEASIPEGVVYAPAEWVGYLTNRRAGNLRPMVNLHVHIIPEEVWATYLRILHGAADWEGLMDRYRINYVVTQKGRNDRLIRELAASTHFARVYEDAQSAVFERKEPIR